MSGGKKRRRSKLSRVPTCILVMTRVSTSQPVRWEYARAMRQYPSRPQIRFILGVGATILIRDSNTKIPEEGSIYVSRPLSHISNWLTRRNTAHDSIVPIIFALQAGQPERKPRDFNKYDPITARPLTRTVPDTWHSWSTALKSIFDEWRLWFSVVVNVALISRFE